MKVLGSILLAVGVAAVAVGAAVAATSGISAPGDWGPRPFGIGIYVAAAGGTLIASVLGLRGWFAPVLSALNQVQRQSPDGLARVAQRTRALRSALQRVAGKRVDVPSYLVFGKTLDGIGFWNSRSELIAAIPATEIQSVEVGQAVTTRTVPSVRITLKPHGSDSAAVVEFIPSRIGFELFPVLDPDTTAAYVAQLRKALTLR